MKDRRDLDLFRGRGSRDLLHGFPTALRQRTRSFLSFGGRLSVSHQIKIHDGFTLSAPCDRVRRIFL